MSVRVCAFIWACVFVGVYDNVCVREYVCLCLRMCVRACVSEFACVRACVGL